MNANQDFTRKLYEECIDEVPKLRDLKGAQRAQLLRFVRDSTYYQINEGIRNKRTILRQVRLAARKKYGSMILMAVLMAVVSFIVKRILERIWPSA